MPGGLSGVPEVRSTTRTGPVARLTRVTEGGPGHTLPPLPGIRGPVPGRPSPFLQVQVVVAEEVVDDEVDKTSPERDTTFGSTPLGSNLGGRPGR